MEPNRIKAPHYLKTGVIKLMDEELKKSNNLIIKKSKYFASAAVFLVIMLLTGFAYDYFSGIKGDQLVFNTEYKGDGIIYIEVENKSHKDLEFTEGVLKTWHDNRELVYLNKKGEQDLPIIKVDMPLIKGGEKKTIVIDMSGCDYKKFEEPVGVHEGYIFSLTNNSFKFGQSWTTAIRFNNKIVKSNYVYQPKEPKDETDVKLVKEIKEKHTLSSPLEELIVTFNYDSSDPNPRVSLAADLGTEIRAITDGVVTIPPYSEYLGNHIIIDHSGGFFTEYAHCSEILVENAQYVKSGDLIGKVGSTGRATGAHLTLNVKYKGENINPLLLFDKDIIKNVKVKDIKD